MSEHTERGRRAVERWLQEKLGWGPERAAVDHVPQLSTPRYAFFVVTQRALPGAAGEIYLMSDGAEVLASNRRHLAAVLAREGLLEDPGALPAAQVAALFFKMAEVRQLRVIEHTEDPALASLSATVRAAFHPPQIERDGDGALLSFYSSGPEPGALEHWQIRLGADGTLSQRVEQLT
jgi:hypothetical protein